MMGDAQYPAVADYVRTEIVQASDVAPLQDVLVRLLTRPGRVLGPPGTAKWPAFVLDSCLALGGDPVAAVAAAAAVEFVVAAADVVDDLVDDEWLEEAVCGRRALNASLALAFLAQRCASRLAGGLGAERALGIGNLITAGYLAACAGEDLDLRLESMSEVSEELAHDMTRRKAGSLVAMACQAGAAIAVDDPAILDLMGRFGDHLGAVAQLLNDLAGIAPGSAERGSDLRRQKKTLPIAYALRCIQEEGLPPLLPTDRCPAALDMENEERLALRVRDLGAIQYTWVVAEAHRREALAVLEELAAMSGREEVHMLRRLVPKVRARRVRRGHG